MKFTLTEKALMVAAIGSVSLGFVGIVAWVGSIAQVVL